MLIDYLFAFISVPEKVHHMGVSTNSRNCNNSSAVKSYFTFWLVKGFYIFQTDCTKVKIMGSYINLKYCETNLIIF